MNRSTVLILLLLIGIFLLTHGRKHGKSGIHNHKTVSKFIHVSDIHVDIFYNQSIDKDTRCRRTEGYKIADFEAPYGRIGCDSPEWLWGNTLAAMKEKGKDADFILLTGTEKCQNTDLAKATGNRARVYLSSKGWLN